MIMWADKRALRLAQQHDRKGHLALRSLLLRGLLTGEGTVYT